VSAQTFPVVRFVFGGHEAAGAGTGRPYTVVYDGACKVCNRLIRVLQRWDRHGEIETLPSQNTSVYARFPWIPAEAYAEALQLVGPGGQTWQGAAAIEKLLDVLPHGRLLGWAFRVPLVGRLIDRFYRWFARNRYHFGCGEHCQLRPLEVDYGDRD
jgi:predicted DCC family thiol-disulfide oxidoreductase YuxK